MQVRKSDLKKVVREVLNEAPKEDPHDYTVLAAVVMDAINEFMTSSKGKALLKNWDFDKSVVYQGMSIMGPKAKIDFKTPSVVKTVTLAAKSK